MTIVKLGYVAMSMNVQNSSPSQTMTVAQFQRIQDREAAIHKLERIALSNLDNCLRLLKYNKFNDIEFFRFSSRLIPLANHEEVGDWNYILPLKEKLKEIRRFLDKNPSRVDFHPDHFVVLNSTDPNVLKRSLHTLQMHQRLLKGMGIPPQHRCVLHVGGGYGDKEKALEQFIHNFGFVPTRIQEMIMLENDDTVFNVKETLYLCEKLSIPLVFDLHHHMANHETEDWQEDWERIVNTWSNSSLPIKMHISSPRNEKEFRAHADYIDVEMFMGFLSAIKNSVPEIHCMIEAKGKDNALLKLMEDLKAYPEIKMINNGSFSIQ
ncbi:UV DNA damage repair endonuclease UvsE [Priestia koreensis]|uniref:UV damage repair endonuclease UvdE n=1 Tax=Priestia koreensis TaxID=284581 RepID=A0A0M0KP30_9BACI|nr:UV DNA damage repair endonuclease UvsE [Priestia koreensis]KOO40367.1 UV damage repair endonuclease UvdE [Priestia koreensis]